MARNILCTCFLLSMCMSAYADDNSHQWVKAINGATISSIEGTFDGGFVAAGTKFVDYRNGALFIRIKPSGNLQWAKTYASKEAVAAAYATLQTSDGGFILAGSIGRSDVDADALIIRLDAAGNILWQKAYRKSSSYDIARSIIPSADGGFFIFGTSSNLSTQIHVWCMKLSPDGQVLWQKSYGNKNSEETFYNAIATNDGGLIFVGSTGDIKDGWVVNSAPWVVKLNQKGKIVWQKTYSTKNDAGWYRLKSTITTTADGGYVVGAGRWVLKLDPNAVLSWARAFDSEGPWGTAIAVSGIRQERDGHILVMGTVGQVQYGLDWVDGDIWIARLDPDGVMFWQKAFGESYVKTFDSLTSIHETTDDGTAFAGNRSVAAGFTDGFVARTSSSGMVCRAFRESMQVSGSEISIDAKTADVRVKKNDFSVRRTHLKQTSISLKISNLCADK